MDSIKNIISYTSKIPTAKPTDSLGSVLEKVKSSHDPIFIFDRKNFIGLVSGSKSMFSKRYPKDTNARTAIINPPMLSSNTSIRDVAKQMISTRLYTLPVFEKKEIKGIITAKSLFSEILNSKELLKKLDDNLQIDKVLTTKVHSKIREVYSYLRKEKTSRIVVVDEKKSIKGIITRRDIQEVFSAPPRKGKTSRTRNNRTFTIEDKDLKKFDFPIAEYMKVRVVTLPINANASEIIKKMLDEKISSIVMIDKNNKPKGIVSIFSILKILSIGDENEKEYEIKISDKHKLISKEAEKDIEKIVDKFAKKFNKKEKIRFIEVTLNAYRNINNKKTAYEIHTRVRCKNGKGYMSKVEDKNLLSALGETLRKIDHQKN